VSTETQQAGPSRADRRRERTRRRLIDAGRALIAERGVAGLRIQEITERADVALGSFYNHFPTKEHLVEQVVSESLTDLAATTVNTAEPSTDPAYVVAAACHDVTQLAHSDPDLARLVVNLSHADVRFTAATYPWARIALNRGIDSGRFVVPDAEVALTSVIGGAFALIREILAGRHSPGAERSFAGFVLAALGLQQPEITKILDALPHR
jgi:AcrR family transcriptional regulator